MKFNTPQDHYSYAFRLLNRAQYPEAEQVLRSFVTQHPKDRLVGNAWYWLGETYYVREDYAQAVDAFRQGFESVPDGAKAPDNLFKLGKTLGKLGNQDQACVVLKQLGVKFRGKAAPVLARAAEEQKAMGCPQQ
jgi:tol-pal system protein YbgF